MLGERSWDWAGRDSSVHETWTRAPNLSSSQAGLWPLPTWPVCRGGTAPPWEGQLPKTGTGPTWAAARWSHSQLKNNWAQSGIFLPFPLSFNLLLRRKSLLNAGVFLTPLLTLTSLFNGEQASTSEPSAGSRIWQKFNDIVLFSLYLFLWLPSIYGTRYWFSIYGGI